MGVAGFAISLLALVVAVAVFVINLGLLAQARRSASAAESSADDAKVSAKASADGVRSAVCPDLEFKFISRPEEEFTAKWPNVNWESDVAVYNRGKGPAILLAVCGMDVEYGQPTAGESLHGAKVAAGGEPFHWRGARKILDRLPKSPGRDDERAGCVLFCDQLDNGYKQGLVWLPNEGRIEMRHSSSLPHSLMERFLTAALGPEARRQPSAEETLTDDECGQIQDGGNG